jgi:hypothetical protein
MDSLKFQPGLPCLTLLCPVGGPPPKWPYSIYGVARLQGGQPAAVFYPLGHTTQYGASQRSIAVTHLCMGVWQEVSMDFLKYC